MAKTFTQCIYDIPSNARHSDGTLVASPVSAFRRRGVYLNNSVVMFVTDNVPHNTVSRLIDAATYAADGRVMKQSKVYLIPLGVMESAAFAHVALDCMQAKLAEQETNQTASLARILKVLQEAEANDQLNAYEKARARRKYEADRRAVLKRTEKLMKELQEGARACDVDPSQAGFKSLADRVRQLQAMTNVRCTMIEVVQDAVANTPATASLAAAVANDEMPVGVALDAMEDQGIDTTAARAVLQGANGSNGQTAANTISGSNGHAAPAVKQLTGNLPGILDVVGTALERSFSVQANNHTRSVVSTLTTQQAAQVCSQLEDLLAKDLARKYNKYGSCSDRQRAWMQVLAVEAQAEAMEAANGQADAAPVQQLAPAGFQLAPHAGQPMPYVEPKAEAPAQQPETVLSVVPELNTRDMTWDVVSKTLTGEASTLLKDVGCFPPTLLCRNGKDKTMAFAKTSESRDAEGELLAVTYRSKQDFTLVILND